MPDPVLRLGLDASGMRSGARRGVRSLEDIRRSARSTDRSLSRTDRSSNRLGRAFRDLNRNAKPLVSTGRRLNAAFAALGVTLGAGVLLRGIINVNREFERLLAQLETVQGSAGDARAAFAALEQLAISTPFQIEELTQAFIELRVRGAQPTREELLGLGDVASAFSMNITDVTRGIASAVAGQSDTLQRLGFIVNITGDQIRLAFGGASETVTRSADEITAAIIRLTAPTVTGAMAREMETINGRVSNLQDSLGSLARAIGEAGLNREIANLVGTLDDLATSLVDSTEDADRFAQSVQRTIGFVKALGNTLTLPLTALGALGAAIAGSIGIVISQALLLFESALNGVIDGLNRVTELGRRVGIDIPQIPQLDFSFAGEALDESVAFMREGFGLLSGNIARIRDGLRQMGDAADATFERVTPSLEGAATAAGNVASEASAAARALAAMEVPEAAVVPIRAFNTVIREVRPLVDESADALEVMNDEIATTEAAGRGMLTVVDSLDGIDFAARRAIGGVLDLVRGFQQLRQAAQLEGIAATLGAISGAGALLGGFTSIASTIFGGSAGPSAAEQERNRILEANNDALERLRVSLTDFRVTADVLDRFLTGLPNVLRGDQLVATRPGQPGFFERLGLSPTELAGLGEELGIQIRDESGRLIPEAFRQLREAVEATIPSLTGFADTLDGLAQERELRDRILGVERTGQQQVEALFGDLAAVAPDLFQRFLGGIDTSDVEAVRGALLSLLDAFALGGDQFAELMGNLTREDFLGWVDSAAGSLEKLDETINATTNAIRNVPAWFRIQSAVLNAAVPDPFAPVVPPAPPIRHPVTPPDQIGGPRPGRPNDANGGGILNPGTLGSVTVNIGPITQTPGENSEAFARRTAEIVKREFQREQLARTGSRQGAFVL